MGAAQEAGAVVTDVTADTPEDSRDYSGLPQVKNKAEVIDYAKGQGWSRDSLMATLKQGGWDSSDDYLAKHTPQELLVFLVGHLAEDGSW